MCVYFYLFSFIICFVSVINSLRHMSVDPWNALPEFVESTAAISLVQMVCRTSAHMAIQLTVLG